MILPVLRAAQHGLALGDVVSDGLFDVNVFAGEHGLDCGKSVPVIGSGDDHSVHVLAIEHRAIVAGALRSGAFFLFDAFDGLIGVPVVDIGDRDNLDVGLLEERVQELISPAAGADQAEPDLVVGAGARAMAGAREARRPRRNSRLFPRSFAA